MALVLVLVTTEVLLTAGAVVVDVSADFLSGVVILAVLLVAGGGGGCAVSVTSCLTGGVSSTGVLRTLLLAVSHG